MSEISDGHIACFVCHKANQRLKTVYTRTFDILCMRCGEYGITMEAIPSLQGISDIRRPIISGWIYEQNLLEITPTITTENISFIANRPRLTFAERRRRLLVYLARETLELDGQIEFTPPATQNPAPVAT